MYVCMCVRVPCCTWLIVTHRWLVCGTHTYTHVYRYALCCRRGRSFTSSTCVTYVCRNMGHALLICSQTHVVIWWSTIDASHSYDPTPRRTRTWWCTSMNCDTRSECFAVTTLSPFLLLFSRCTYVQLFHVILFYIFTLETHMDRIGTLFCYAQRELPCCAGQQEHALAPSAAVPHHRHLSSYHLRFAIAMRGPTPHPQHPWPSHHDAT